MAAEAELVMEALARQGVEIRADGGLLRLRPASAVLPEQLETARRSKATILAALELEPRIETALAEGAELSTKELALRLGRPADDALYAALGWLNERGIVATDGISAKFYLHRKGTLDSNLPGGGVSIGAESRNEL